MASTRAPNSSLNVHIPSVVKSCSQLHVAILAHQVASIRLGMLEEVLARRVMLCPFALVVVGLNVARAGKASGHRGFPGSGNAYYNEG